MDAKNVDDIKEQKTKLPSQIFDVTRNVSAFIVSAYVLCSIVVFLIGSSRIQVSISDANNNRGYKRPDVKDLAIEMTHCLRGSSSPYLLPDNFDPVHSNKDKRKKEHYLELLNKTKVYRDTVIHSWAGYDGPWIEDVWIANFCCNRSLSDFGPFVPLFIPWLNIFKVSSSLPSYRDTITRIFSLLRTDMLYVTVVMSSLGIEASQTISMPSIPPNILILSPTSRGHVPIPHMLRELQPIDPKPATSLVTFLGSTYSHQSRANTIQKFKQILGQRFSDIKHAENWRMQYGTSSFVLSPRGTARACFRTYEILQLGLIPIVVTDVHQWMPYKDTSVPWDDMAFFWKVNELDSLIPTLLNVTEERKSQMRQTILSFRDTHFTYNGIMKQIEEFLVSGEVGSDLRCDTYHWQQ